MLPFQKKKSNAAPVQAPAWHPNFRHVDALPDIKPVRTAFFVNGVAIFAVLTIAIFCGVQEFQLHSLHKQIEKWTADRDRDKPGSTAAIGLFNKFKTEEARIREVDEFLKSKPLVSDLIIHLGQTLPKDIALDTFDLKDTGVSLKATIRGAPDTAAGKASAYIELLKGDKVLAPQFDDISQTNIGRSNSGRLTIELFLKFKGATVKKP